MLNRDDIGALEPGMAADCVAFDFSRLGFAGGLHDPVAALLFCGSQTVSWSVINGRVVVREGHLATVDLPPLVERHNKLARALVNGEG